LLFVRLIVSASSSFFHWHVWDRGIPPYERQVIACQLLALFARQKNHPLDACLLRSTSKPSVMATSDDYGNDNMES